MFIFLEKESEERLFCKVELIVRERMSYEEFKIFVFTCKYITCISMVHNFNFLTLHNNDWNLCFKKHKFLFDSKICIYYQERKCGT